MDDRNYGYPYAGSPYPPRTPGGYRPPTGSRIRPRPSSRGSRARARMRVGMEHRF